MEDEKIIELFWTRSEEAIRETAAKYGALCHHIAANILSSQEDCEECVSDTYLGVWNAIPDQRPKRFAPFLSKIVRNLALKKLEYLSAAKRNPEAVMSFEELEECVSGRDSIESELENRRIEEAISRFLAMEEKEKRMIFICRYWYFEPIESICRRTGYSQSKVKSMLYHMRKKLREHLEKEGIEL